MRYVRNLTSRPFAEWGSVRTHAIFVEDRPERPRRSPAVPAKPRDRGVVSDVLGANNPRDSGSRSPRRPEAEQDRLPVVQILQRPYIDGSFRCRRHRRLTAVCARTFRVHTFGTRTPSPSCLHVLLVSNAPDSYGARGRCARRSVLGAQLPVDFQHENTGVPNPLDGVSRWYLDDF